MSLAELKEKIKDVSISEIIGHYIPLTSRGQNKLGLCPFHSDSKPSLTVSDTKGLYKCFACGAGGDAITFVEKFKNLNFVEALEECSKIVGITFEEYKQEKKKSPKTIMAEKILGKSSQLFQKLAESEQHKDTFGKFLVDRKLDSKTAEKFSLGFASFNSTVSTYLLSIKDKKDKEFAIKVAADLGIIRAKDGSHYDTFRNRIMFPIWDQFGKVVGFGGRATTPEGMPKYLNSGESFHFNKRNILYGLHLAKQEIRNQDAVILVEGYMDMISLYHHGFRNTVAVMGIALSDYAINRLKGMCKNFYLALDSDDAGIKAMSRMNQSLLKHGVVAKLVRFDPEKDPDDFVTKLGPLALRERIDEAPHFLDWELKQLIPEVLPEISSQKLEILHRVFIILAPLGESLEATERVINMAKKLGLNSNHEQFIKAYQDHLSGIKKPRAVAVQTDNARQEVDKEQVSKKELNKISKLDKILLEELISHPELLTSPKVMDLLDFVHNVEVKTFVLRLKDLVYEIDEAHYETFITNLLGTDEFSTQIREVVGASLFKFQKTELSDKVKDRLFEELKVKIHAERLKLRKQELKHKQTSLTKEEELNSLMKEILSIDKEIINLKNKKPRTTI